jgi:hypothetical protein
VACDLQAQESAVGSSAEAVLVHEVGTALGLGASVGASTVVCLV